MEREGGDERATLQEVEQAVRREVSRSVVAVGVAIAAACAIALILPVSMFVMIAVSPDPSDVQGRAAVHNATGYPVWVQHARSASQSGDTNPLEQVMAGQHYEVFYEPGECVDDVLEVALRNHGPIVATIVPSDVGMCDDATAYEFDLPLHPLVVNESDEPVTLVERWGGPDGIVIGWWVLPPGATHVEVRTTQPCPRHWYEVHTRQELTRAPTTIDLVEEPVCIGDPPRRWPA